MIKISDIKWKYKKFTNYQELYNVFMAKLTRLQLSHRLRVNGETLEFIDFEDGKIIASSVKNMHPMREGDPRIARFKRNYLESPRPTKKQVDGFIQILNGTLDELALSAKIEVDSKFTGNKITVRDGTVRMDDKFPRPKTYPAEMKKG